MGNGSCDLSFVHIRETADLQPIGTVRNPDFDLYIKKIDCKLNIPRVPPESHPIPGTLEKPYPSHHKPDYLYGQDHEKYPDNPNRPNSFDTGFGHKFPDYTNRPVDQFIRPIQKPEMFGSNPGYNSEEDKAVNVYDHPSKRPDLGLRPTAEENDPYLSLVHPEGPSRIPPPPSYESYAQNFLRPPSKGLSTDRPHGPFYKPEPFYRPYFPEEEILTPTYTSYHNHRFRDHFWGNYRPNPFHRPHYQDR